MGDHSSMKEVFVQCQTGLQGHGKLMKTLLKIYDKTEFDAFWPKFNHYLKYAMIVFKREPAVERMIDFVAKFVTSLSKKASEKGEAKEDGNEGEDEADSVTDNRLLQEMFDFLLKSHSARDRGVRFRCCQLINKLLTNLGEDALIDDELYDRLYECMLERLKDKCPVVRYHAVMAMGRLQDPTDENCPVIKAYLFLLNCDPNPDVRRAVLSAIAPSTKTLGSIVGRTRDVKDTVRKTAYEVLAEKIHIKALSIALRLQLLNEGLNDRAEIVKQACSGKLLSAWMRTFSGNILDLLKSLDVEDSTDICSRVLETLFKAASTEEMVKQFDILNEQLLVPLEELSSESAMYWQAVCKYIQGLGTDGDEYMEKVMPTVVDFCAYMQRYVDDLQSVDDPEIQLSREFIIEQLLLITSYMDTADTASRKALETLLHNMLMADHVSHRLVKSVVSRICALRGTGDSLVPYFAETVSEIREPITIVEKDVETEQKRQINLKIAGIRVQLNQLREDLDKAVKEENFSEAAEIKKNIAQLDQEKNQLLQTSEPVREEVRSEKNDPLTILKCQMIMSEMLQILKLNNVSPTLQMMIESQIVPGIQNEDAEVRNVAMQALGLCCYLSKDLLVTYIPLFMQASQIDVEGVRVTALQVLFDLLLIYGLEIVDASEGSSSDTSELPQGGEGLDSTTVSSEAVSRNSDSRTGTASKLVAIICSFLDGESSELRTCAAEGLAKLLLSGRVVSSKILSHLILLWYNPLSEDDTHLRDCLGTFFPLYALASRSNQEVVEEAFLPTLRTLLNAPATSPLAEVDINNVAELLVQLTNTKLLTANQNNTELSLDNPGHDNLAETVCNEILSKPDSNNVKLWSKILNQMEVSPDNEVVLKDLRVLAYKMVKTVKERLSLKALQKFQSRIEELANKFVTENDDLTNIEIEPVVQVVNDALEDTLDTTAQTPKRKRVRGLYSQNMTLALESEEELDIVEDSTVEVDASCLMSRSASVDTPPRRGRKNTTTEVAEDDVFTIPEVPEEKEQSETQKSEVKEVTGEPETEQQGATKSPGKKSPEKTTKDKEPDSETNDESESPTARKSRASAKDSPKKSPGKSAEKRKASASPENTSPEKRIASESPARRSQEKRKASKSPARDRKRLSQSPLVKSPETRQGSKSPEKRKASKSPIREDSVKRKPSKSPVKDSKIPDSKSPAKSTKQKENKVASQKAGSMKAADKGKIAPNKTASAAVKASGRSPVKTTSNAKKSPVKPTGKETTKPPARVLAKEVNKTQMKPTVTQTKPIVSKDKTEIAKAGAKKPLPASIKTAGVKHLEKPVNKGPEKGVNIRKALPKAAESPKGKVKPAGNQKGSEVATKSTAKPTGSPVKGKAKPTANEKSPRLTRGKLEEASKSDSPRNIRRAANMTVEDTPEQVSRRMSSRSTVGVTPDVNSPRSKRAGKEMTVAETPDLDVTTSGKATTRSVANTPELKSAARSVRGSRVAADSPKRRGGMGAVTPSASSASESSPEKSVIRSAKATRAKVLQTSESETSSPDAPRGKGTKKPSPTKASIVEASDNTEEEEDVPLKRKAKPSRRSATASASASVVSTPPAAARSTRSSIAQSSSVSSPATGLSPRQPRSSMSQRSAVSSPAVGSSPRRLGSPAQGTKKGMPKPSTSALSPGTSSQGSVAKGKEAVRRSTRGAGDVSSQESSLSLLSQKSSASSGKSKSSVSSKASTSSVASKKTAATKSKTASEVVKSTRQTATATTVKARSAAATKPAAAKTEASRRKRPLRSTRK